MGQEGQRLRTGCPPGGISRRQAKTDMDSLLAVRGEIMGRTCHSLSFLWLWLFLSLPLSLE
jgi:hypothetical protein